MSKSQYSLVLLVAMVSGLVGGVTASWLLPVRVLRAARFEAVDKRGKVRATLDKSGLVFLPQEGETAPVALDAERSSLRLFGYNAGDRIELSATERLLRLSDGQGKSIWKVPTRVQPQEVNATQRGLSRAPAPSEAPSSPSDPQVTLDMPPRSPAESPVTIESAPQAGEGKLATAKRVPHPACPYCFKLVCDNCYGIWEEVPGTGVIINREIPDPAPPRPGEVRSQLDKSGQPIWYIGHQAYVGPTDEEPFSPDLPIAKIELLRIKARHEREVMSISGVHGFGIGAKGFVVFLLPDKQENASQIPKALEGIPITVEIHEMATTFRR